MTEWSSLIENTVSDICYCIGNFDWEYKKTRKKQLIKKLISVLKRDLYKSDLTNKEGKDLIFFIIEGLKSTKIDDIDIPMLRYIRKIIRLNDLRFITLEKTSYYFIELKDIFNIYI